MVNAQAETGKKKKKIGLSRGKRCASKDWSQAAEPRSHDSGTNVGRLEKLIQNTRK